MDIPYVPDLYIDEMIVGRLNFHLNQNPAAISRMVSGACSFTDVINLVLTQGRQLVVGDKRSMEGVKAVQYKDFSLKETLNV